MFDEGVDAAKKPHLGPIHFFFLFCFQLFALHFLAFRQRFNFFLILTSLHCTSFHCFSCMSIWRSKRDHGMKKVSQEVNRRAELPQEVRNIYFFGTFEFRWPFFSFPFACHIYYLFMQRV